MIKVLWASALHSSRDWLLNYLHLLPTRKKMFLQVLLISYAIFYIVIGSRLFTHWLDIMQRDASIGSNIVPSIIFLLIVTTLWPIVVPFAYIELLVKSQCNRETIKIVAEQIQDSFYAESESV